MSEAKQSDLTELLSLKDAGERFGRYINKRFRRQVLAATHYDVSAPFISAVVNGKKGPTAEMLADMGLKKVSGYIER